MKGIHLAIFIAVMMLIGFPTAFFIFIRTTSDVAYVTSFVYSDDILNTLPKSSPLTTTFDDFVRMDRDLFRIVSRLELSETEAVRFYTHVALAQHDFIQLSYGKTGTYSGSIIPITKKVICHVLTQACGDMHILLDDMNTFTDEYTAILTESVYTAFLKHETEHAMYSTITPVSDIQTVAVDEGLRSSEALSVLEFVSTRTEDKLRTAIFWDGTTGSKRNSGIWLSILDEYLDGFTKTHTLIEIVNMRTNAFVSAHDAYMQTLSYGYRNPRKSLQSLQPRLISVLSLEEDDIAPIPDVAFITALSSILIPYLQGEAIDLFIEERDEAITSRLWSGAYVPSDVAEAERIGVHVAEYTREKYIE